MLAYENIKIPSVTSQTSGIPLQNCGSPHEKINGHGELTVSTVVTAPGPNDHG